MPEIQETEQVVEKVGPKVSVLILSFNQVTALRRCLAAIEQSAARDRIEVLVMDCGSRDGSATLDGEFPNTTFLRMPRHFGATKAFNIGVRTATGEYLFLLDQEVELAPDTVSRLAAVLDESPEAGAAAPLLVNAKGEVVSRAYPLPTRESLQVAWREGELPGALPIDTGAERVEVEYLGRKALMVRRQFVKGMNYFDERYGQHWADAELAFQIRHAGKKTYLLPGLRAIDHSDEAEFPWQPQQLATLSADCALGAAAYVGKHYSFMTGVGFRVSVIVHSFAQFLMSLFKGNAGFQLKRLIAVVSGQKVDGSQTSF
jgi:GT2 family glycosyltransferase